MRLWKISRSSGLEDINMADAESIEEQRTVSCKTENDDGQEQLGAASGHDDKIEEAHVGLAWRQSRGMSNCKRGGKFERKQIREERL